jgi:NhaP-type Na+/H+ or K+/H+ antiporter
MTHTFQDLSALGLSLLAFAGAELIGGNGFIAAFAAGITIGNCCRSVCTCLYEFAEAEGQLLTLLIFMVVGLVMVPLEHMSWQLLVYGVLSLTIIRMLPVALSVIGLGLQPATTVFLGWFGPRGIASILFVLLVIEEFDLAGEETIFAAAVTTVLLSVLAHGLTAFPASKWYSEHITTRAPEGGEHVPVSDMPVRLPLPPSEGAVV